MKKISSTDNQYIKDIAKLDSAKERYKQLRYSAHGIRICSTLIQAGEHIEQLFVTESMLTQGRNLCFEDSITVVSDSVMHTIAHTTTPSGIVGIFALPKKPSPEIISSGIVLYNVTDPGNVGTLMRSCVAFGKKTIVCVEGVDPWNPKVIQASAGTIGSATIFTWSWQELLRNKKNLTLCALVVHGGKPPHQITITETLMVIGNEAHGIPQEMLTTCDELLTLPMPGQTESLNAAVAGSIGMYSLWVNT